MCKSPDDVDRSATAPWTSGVVFAPGSLIAVVVVESNCWMDTLAKGCQ